MSSDIAENGSSTPVAGLWYSEVVSSDDSRAESHCWATGSSGSKFEVVTSTSVWVWSKVSVSWVSLSPIWRSGGSDSCTVLWWRGWPDKEVLTGEFGLWEVTWLFLPTKGFTLTHGWRFFSLPSLNFRVCDLALKVGFGLIVLLVGKVLPCFLLRWYSLITWTRTSVFEVSFKDIVSVMLIKCGWSWTLVLVVERVRWVSLAKGAKGLADASWSLLMALSMNWKVRPSSCRNLSFLSHTLRWHIFSWVQFVCKPRDFYNPCTTSPQLKWRQMVNPRSSCTFNGVSIRSSLGRE